MEEEPPIGGEQEPKAVPVQTSARLAATLAVGLLLGASLGPALFLAIDRLELKGDLLLSFAIGAFLTLGACLVLAAVAVLLLLPRVFAGARGTLTAVVDDLTQASRAHALGNSDAALTHFGRAVNEGAAWYSVGAARRFAVQAALGLLISFGGSIGAVLLFSQNALLRDQNGLLREQNKLTQSQLSVLTDQNEKIDKQLRLLTDQNEKIDQQTAVADAQKRGAFVTELFSIVQEVAREIGKADRPHGELSKELVTRIAVLTSSAVPYRYMDQRDERRRFIPYPLSPERGQLVVALARMNVSLSSLSKAGADFTRSDLRGFDLDGADFSGAHLFACDFSFSNLTKAKFVGADLSDAIFNDVNAQFAKFTDATLFDTKIEKSRFAGSNFDRVRLHNVTFIDADLTESSFVDTHRYKLAFTDTALTLFSNLPRGIPWSPAIESELNAARERSSQALFRFSYQVPDGKPPQ